MVSDSHFRIVEGEETAHEFMEGEVVILHFASGNFYSLKGIAAELWEWFAGWQASRPQILEALGPLAPEQAQSVDAFLDALLSEGLLAEAGPAGPGPALPKCTFPFEPPALEKHSDLREFMEENPAHPVDITRWRTPPVGAA